MNAKELHRFELLATLDMQLMGGQEPLEARLRSIPNGWRDYKMVLSRLGKLIEQIYQTMPDKAVAHMINLCRYGETIVRLKPAGGGGYMQPVDVSDLRVLINTAMEGECLICDKDRHGAKKCKLRKSLMIIAPPVHVTDDCPYKTVVDQSMVGDYI